MSMRLMVNQMINCAERNFFYPAIITACTLPDICGALDSDGNANGFKYKKCFNAYAAKYYEGNLSGNDAYALRNAILHQGRVTHSGFQQHKAFGFIEAHSHIKSGKNFAENFYFIAVDFHCHKVGQAVVDWLNIVEHTPAYQENYKKLFKRVLSEEFTRLYDIPILFAL